MKIAAIILSFTVWFSSTNSTMWGRTGHYVTGEIAEQHLTEKTLQEIRRVLGSTTLAESTTWMDRVRSSDEYGHTRDWHWVTIPPGETYAEAEKNPNGDIIAALERKIGALKEGGLEEKREWEMLKMVIHMVGDIHQPLHVGTGEDLGGNRVDVEWMGSSSNLHRLWDSGMISSWSLDHLELTRAINHPTEELVRQWQSATVREWAGESVTYRDQVYDLPEDGKIGWQYRNKNFAAVEKRLLQAGVRLAGVLNDIYDPG